MKTDVVQVGQLHTNCYIYSDEGEAIILDPGFEREKILTNLTGLKPIAIILTHGHFDHVTEAFNLKDKIKAPVHIHESDNFMLVKSTGIGADRFMKDKDIIRVGSSEFKIIHTPGHTPGGICLHNEKDKIIFTGDTLFYKDYGRTDLPFGSQEQMEKSLEILFSLPPDTQVFSGHGRSSTIADAKGMIL